MLGTGSYLPSRVVTNDEVGGPAGVDDEWIVRKTGILRRRWAKDEEATSDLATIAARTALEDAGLRASDLSLIIVATSTPDSPQPPTAASVAYNLEAPPTAAAFDLNAVCTGFAFALSLAHRALLGSGGYALVIGADMYSRILNPADRRTVTLFGDGAGAVVLGPLTAGREVLATRLLTFGEERDLVSVPAGGSRLGWTHGTVEDELHYFRMNGRGVKEFVGAGLPPALDEFLDEAGVTRADIKHVVPHQGNAVMLRELAGQLGLPRARMHSTVEEYGNTGAASVAITLDHAARSGSVRRGDQVLLAAFGGGFSFGFALVRW
ncbi:ketoacyl-ACP synthase III [Streptomyces sp. NPDC049577]|uniref:3-oxoacyl-ACP synthase III family protein n=1 Tax=Streptomyces sp. NPDC049577 TaxID=3155153 RepID=UPI003427678A